MTFRVRLASFLVASLAILQILTAMLVYEVTRRQLIAQGEQQLVVAGKTFARQLDDVSARVADNVQVLTLDFALRSAIAQRDRDTVAFGAAQSRPPRRRDAHAADRTGWRDPGRHFGYFSTFGQISFYRSDRCRAGASGGCGRRVGRPRLLDGRRAGIGAGTDRPDRRGDSGRRCISGAFAGTVDAAEHDRTCRTGRGWTLERGRSRQRAGANSPTQSHYEATAAFRRHQSWSASHGREYVALATHLESSRSSAPIIAVLGYSLDDALRPYRSVATAWAILLALGLAVRIACGAAHRARRVAAGRGSGGNRTAHRRGRLHASRRRSSSVARSANSPPRSPTWRRRSASARSVSASRAATMPRPACRIALPPRRRSSRS